MPVRRTHRHSLALLRAVATALAAGLCGAAFAADDHDLCGRSGADPDAGIPACTRLIDRERDGDKAPDFYNSRGVGKVRAGDPRAAIDDFSKALDRRPRFIDPLRNRGISWHILGEFDRAIADFTQALRIDRRSAVILNARGLSLLNKEEYDRAIADFTAAIGIDPGFAKAFNNRGLAYLPKRDLARALADFNEVLRLRPDDPIGYENRAALLMDKADVESAIADYDAAIRLNPKNWSAYSRRGEAWRLRGDLEKSLADHNKAVELEASVDAFNNRALTWKDMGKLDDAIADLGEAILLNPKDFRSYTNRGDIRRQKGELDGALADLNRAVGLNPRSPFALTYRGDLFRRRNDPDRAIVDYTEAVRLIPDFVAAYAGRAQAHETKANLAAAKADFQKALSLSPDADAALARPAQDAARKRLAAIAEAEVQRTKEAATAAAAKATAEGEAKQQAARVAKSASETRVVAEADVKVKADAERRAKAEFEARVREEAEARAKLQIDARVKAEVSARAKAEEASRTTAQADAKRLAAAEALARAEAEARFRTEIEARTKAEFEARVKAEVELRTKAQAEAAQAEATAEAAKPSGPRIALVIGNANYRNTAPLTNPKNDAADMAAALRRIGFEVIDGVDLDKRGMEMSLARFARLAQTADAALVYYAGHGLQHEGQNYLVPVDARLEDEISLQFEMTRLDDVLGALARAPGARLLFLDACRNNPLAEKMAASGGRPTRGLAKVASVPGLATVFATQANTVAYDGTGRNSLFTGALVQAVAEPRLEITQVFRRVAASVTRATGGKQTPELSLALSREFYFNLGETDAQVWARLRSTGNPAELEAFVARFPASAYVREAKARIAETEQAREPADGARAKPEKTRGMEAEPEAPRADAAAPSLRIAAVPSGGDAPPPAGPLVQAIRGELKRLGCYSGPDAATWSDAPMRTALARYAKASGTQEPAAPEAALLVALQKQVKRLCPAAR